jgi:hypothetical protein
MKAPHHKPAPWINRFRLNLVPFILFWGIVQAIRPQPSAQFYIHPFAVRSRPRSQAR